MVKLAIHTTSGAIITAPFEAWVVALINALPGPVQQEVFRRVSQLDGASLVPDKYLIKEDGQGTIQIVERPILDLGKKM